MKKYVIKRNGEVVEELFSDFYQANAFKEGIRRGLLRAYDLVKSSDATINSSLFDTLLNEKEWNLEVEEVGDSK